MSSTTREAAAPALAGARLRRVLDFIETSLDQDVALAGLAEAAGVSPSRFARGFKSATGRPPHRYVVGRRVDRGRALLAATDLPIIDVAHRCGFASPQHFATVFKRLTGATPRAYRAIRRRGSRFWDGVGGDGA